ncbi:MAG: hypothetical protein WA984_03180, partial [Phormidesmis sp.]
GLLLGYYLLYAGYLAANATNPDSLWLERTGMVIVPLTLLLLALLSWHVWKSTHLNNRRQS